MLPEILRNELNICFGPCLFLSACLLTFKSWKLIFKVSFKKCLECKDDSILVYGILFSKTNHIAEFLKQLVFIYIKDAAFYYE